MNDNCIHENEQNELRERENNGLMSISCQCLATDFGGVSERARKKERKKKKGKERRGKERKGREGKGGVGKEGRGKEGKERKGGEEKTLSEMV